LQSLGAMGVQSKALCEKAINALDLQFKTLCDQSANGFIKRAPENVIVFDWDDTLFPTTALKTDADLSVYEPLDYQEAPEQRKEEFAKCADTLEQILRLASSFGKILVVTLTSTPWMTLLSEIFIPRIGELLRELKVEIIYARHVVQFDDSEVYGLTGMEQICFWGKVKGDATADALSRCYAQSGGRVLRNIVSFGDSEYDCLGTRCGTRKFLEAEGHTHTVCTKTLKLIPKPTAAELLFEMCTMLQWLPSMVGFEHSFDVEITCAKDMGKPQIFERRTAAKNLTQCFKQYIALWEVFKRGFVMKQKEALVEDGAPVRRSFAV